MKDLGEEGIAKSLLGGDVTTGTLDNEGMGKRNSHVLGYTAGEVAGPAVRKVD